MVQNPLTVIVNIKPAERQALSDVLTIIGQDIRHNQYLRFPEIGSTHFARFVMIGGGDRSNRDDQTRLYFSSNHDGDWQSYIDLLVRQAAPGLHEIFRHCEGYPAISPADSNFKQRFRDFIAANKKPTDTFYSGYPNRSVKEVQSYIKVRKALGDLINQPQLEPLFEAVSHLPLPQPKRSGTPVSSAGLELLQPVLHRLFTPNISDQPASGISREVDTRPDQTDWLYTVQNEMTVVSAIDPDPAALKRLQQFLWIINFAARWVFNKGTLGGIATIHFARWAIIDNGTNLLFESNYDGNWEQYIGDFVDKASFGMDGIWGNCKGFPSRGCKDLQAFKQIIIDHQVRAHVFYSAYRYESIRNVLDYIAISDKLNQLLDQPELADWLRRL